MLFFSALVLPLLFTRLGSAEAGPIAAMIFPYYYKTGLVLALIVAVCAGFRARAGLRPRVAAFIVAVIICACQAYGALLLQPEMAALRGSENGVARFQLLHKRSVRLNGTALLGAFSLLVAAGWARESR